MIIWASYDLIIYYYSILISIVICQEPAVVRRVWRASGAPTVTTAAPNTVPMATAATRRRAPASVAMGTGDPPVRRVSDETDS